MRIGILEPKREIIQQILPRWERVLGPGFEATNNIHSCDVVLCYSYSQMERAEPAQVPIFSYCWDLYEWALTYPGYDYNRYRKILERSVEVWVPSQCTADRLKEFWGITNTHVIKTSIPVYDRETRDDNFVLQPLRELPDKWVGWVEKACAELDIPCKSPDHSLKRDEFEDTVASCSFIVSGYYEASTGALTAMEGYYLGKPVLGSGSPYCGLRDYLGDRAEYFTTYEELKEKLKSMWYTRPQVALDHREYILQFSEEAMGRAIAERIKLCAPKKSS